MIAQIKQQYLEYLKTNNLKSSKRRDFIFEFIIQKKGHFTIDDIYPKLLVLDPDIGIATIYRTIRLLVDSGILIEQTFGEKKGYFELINHQLSNHGHLICLKCGKIVEFDNELFENHQKTLKKNHGFKIHSLKLEAYGLCKKCAESRE
jgi:Fur family transcriptional regulator, ferric uptake regulator